MISMEEQSVSVPSTLIFTSEQLAKIAQKTPDEFIETYNAPGAEGLVGVKWPYLLDLINEVIGAGNWETEIDPNSIRYDKLTDGYTCSVYVTVRILGPLMESGFRPSLWTFSTIGATWSSRQVTYGNAAKAAHTDGIKKIFSCLGFCRDVYSGLVAAPSKKKKARGGKITLTEEEKETYKHLKSEITGIVKSVMNSLSSKDADDLTEYEQHFPKSKEEMFELFTKIIANGVTSNELNSSFNPESDTILSWSDIVSLEELKFIYTHIQTYVKGLK